MDTLTWRALAITAFASGAVYGVVRGVELWALRNLLDQPNARSSHTIPTPRGGGLGIALAICVAWLLAASLGPVQGRALLQAGLVAAVAALGWLDDLYSLSARLRLALQVVLALLTVALWGPCHAFELPFLGTFSLGVFAWPVSLLGLVGLLNAYNFMDGIDGIAGAQGLLAGASWCAFAELLGLPTVAVVALGCVAGCLGFLPRNRPRARIFMGDVGSTTLGYTFALLPLCAASLASSARANRLPLAALLAVWPFVLDAGFTFMRRLLRGENVLAAHRSHLYQRATIAGGSHGRVTLSYAALALACGASAVLWLRSASGAAALALLGSLLLTPALLLAWVALAERRKRASAP